MLGPDYVYWLLSYHDQSMAYWVPLESGRSTVDYANFNNIKYKYFKALFRF